MVRGLARRLFQRCERSLLLLFVRLHDVLDVLHCFWHLADMAIALSNVCFAR